MRSVALATTLATATASVLVALCHASPIALDESPGQSFTLEELHNANHTACKGLEGMIMVYVKYNLKLPLEVMRAIELNGDIGEMYRNMALGKRAGDIGTIAATPPQGFDTEYVVPVQIGTPPQTLNLILDTGSADLWVFSAEMPQSQIRGQKVWDPSKSSTARKQAGQSWAIRYGDGSKAGGSVYQDRVQLGATSVNSQIVESASQVSEMFSQDAFSSGVLGLAKSGVNMVQPTKALSYMDNVKSRLVAPVFTANLKKGGPGNYNFGYVAQNEYTGSIQYAKTVDSSSYWQFVVNGFQVGSDKSRYVNKNWYAVADTGTTLLLLPSDIASAYWAHVPGAFFSNEHGAIIFPCGATLPQFVFGIGLYRGLVPGNYLNYGAIDGTYCYGGLQSSDGIGFSIFGLSLIKTQFVVFDVGNNRIGWANKRMVSA